MKNVLITGVNGFVGGYLVEHLTATGEAVFGVDIHPAGTHPGVTYAQVDITDLEALSSFVATNQITRIYHLAAIANPRVADAQPIDAVRVNVLGPSNLLEIARLSPGVRVLFVGSSEQYHTKEGKQIQYTETDPQGCHNFYGATKIAFETIGREYHRRYGVEVYFTRSFNHTGPGQPTNYVIANFVAQVRAIARGEQDPRMRVGNIDAARDFIDVRDVVTAYEAIIEGGTPGETYNVCSGTVHSLRDLLSFMLAEGGLTSSVSVEVDPALLRPDDPEIVYGDNTKLRTDTGWQPTRKIEETVREMVRG